MYRVFRLLFLLSIASVHALGLSIEVPSGLYQDIQSGINAVLEGDSVVVLPGVHTGQGNRNLDFHGKNIVLISRDGSEFTTIDLEGEDRALILTSGESLESVFAGFRIENAAERCIYLADASLSMRDLHLLLLEDGKGIGASNASVVIEDMSIDGQEFWNTKGIGLSNCDATISNVRIVNCKESFASALDASNCVISADSLEIRSNWAGNFAPVYISYGSAFIDNSLFVDCYGDIGGALQIYHSIAEVTNSTFIDNDADRFGGAVALKDEDTLGTFTNCSFIRNSADNAGAGMICYESAHGSLIGCAFYGNRGNAIRVSWSQSFLNLDNTLVAFNEGFGITTDVAHLVEIDCCDFFANSFGNYDGLDDPTGLYGNISEDPMFCNEGSEDEPLTVSANSPCLPENNDCGLLIGPSAADCELLMYAITGHIEDKEGLPIIGAELSGHYETYITDENGDYEIPSIEGWSGTISPYFENYHFTPENREYQELPSDIQSEDYLAYFSTLHQVPSEYPSIGEALEIALEGDTILVAPGTYTGSNNRDMEFQGENVVLMSEQGPDITTIDCENLGRAFVIHFGENSSTIIDGFTIRGGLANENLIGGERGGAILIHGASPTLRNLVLFENTCPEGYGGGMALEDCSSVLEDIRFIENEASGFYGKGGGIHLQESNPTITGCLFHRNYAFRYGGGICGEDSPFHISNSTFVNNVAGWGGGAVAGDSSNGAFFDAVILAFNRSTGGGAVFHGNHNYPFVFTCSVFFDNGEIPYSGSFIDPVGFDGNIEADPDFCDPGSEDFTLQSSSPCLPENNSCALLIGAYDQGCP